MARVHLTDKRVKAIKPPTNGRRKYVHDDAVSGLLVSVTATGSKTFMMQTRFGHGKQATRRALGTPGTMTVEQAREKARQWHALLDRHIDPKVQVERDRLEAIRAQGHSFLAVAEAYFVHVRAEGLRKAQIMERVIRKELINDAGWGERAIHEITR